MASIQASSGQGALFELVARGVKDTYFVKDHPESQFTYDASYQSSCPHLGERRTVVPLNGTAFGGTFEVEIDRYGDVLTECALEVELPTWLPPLPILSGEVPTHPSVANGLYPITTTGLPTGMSYGYVNGIGWYLFERIQFYQDQMLIQEWSGDGLLTAQLTEGSYQSSYVRLEQGGWSSGEDVTRSLQLRATPSTLRISLPLPGLQRPGDTGLPLLAMTWQSLRLRITLRRLEDLVVSTGSELQKPAPWAVPSFTYVMEDGVPYSFAPLSRLTIGPPTILLSTVQRYLPPDAQQAMRNAILHIPFRRMFENRFTFGELDFIALDKGGVASVTRRLDGRHPTERLFWFFRLSQSVERNRLDDVMNPYFEDHPPTAVQPVTSPYGEFYYRLKLVIAGKDREFLESGEVWNQMVPWSKQERTSPSGIGSMVWGLGDRFGMSDRGKQPEGSINMTTADRPTLYLELANVPVNPLLAQRLVEMRVFSEGWNVYEIKGGRGRMLFAS